MSTKPLNIFVALQMKVSRICNAMPNHSRFKFNLHNQQLGVPFYSTLAATEAKKPWTGPPPALYHRISPVGDPRVSIVPILDQWIHEGRTVLKHELVYMIKELRCYKRYTHALELSKWMTDKRYIYLTSSDVAIRLDLISKVHGIEQAENYFNNIPENLKVQVYGVLLNCYVNAKSVDKAEAVFHKMRDLGLAMCLSSYNTLLNLYKQTENYEKLDNLLHEMEVNNISFDKFTYCICMDAFAANSNIDRMEKMLRKMESDNRVTPEWSTYASVANAYTKKGQLDKAVVMLKKSEGLVTPHKMHLAYDFLLTQYAATGNKSEVLRIWEVYKKKQKVFNRGYMRMISSLLKLGDIEGAEKIFEEWESQNLNFDIRVPNFLIGYYIRKGLVDKALNLINKVLLKGGKLNAMTWYYLATAHLLNNETLKAVGAMKEVMKICAHGWKPGNENFAVCLDYLKREGDVEGAEEFIRLMGEKNIVSIDVQQRLLDYIKGSNSPVDESCTDT